MRKEKLYTLGVATNVGIKHAAGLIAKVSAFAGSGFVFTTNDNFTFDFTSAEPMVTVTWGNRAPLSKKDLKRFGLDGGISFES